MQNEPCSFQPQINEARTVPLDEERRDAYAGTYDGITIIWDDFEQGYNTHTCSELGMDAPLAKRIGERLLDDGRLGSSPPLARSPTLTGQNRGFGGRRVGLRDLF